MAKNDDPTEPSAPVMDYAEFIETLSNGDANRYLSEKLSEVVAAVKECQKAGKLVIELSIKPEAHLAKVDIGVKLTLPQPAVPGTIFFFRGDTALSREDPRQLTISLRDVGAKPAAPLKDLDPRKDS